MRLKAALIPVIVLSMAFATLCAAQDGGVAKAVAGTNEPIDVKADTTEFRSKENLIVFSGSVTALRGPMTINSDRLEVYLVEGSKDVKEIRALGNVSIKREDVLATGARAVYVLKDDTVTLTGSPKIWRGADMVEGETVVMHPNEERMEVKGQTRVLMNPEAPRKAEEK